MILLLSIGYKNCVFHFNEILPVNLRYLESDYSFCSSLFQGEESQPKLPETFDDQLQNIYLTGFQKNLTFLGFRISLFVYYSLASTYLTNEEAKEVKQ
jgi:hypothetical protein